LSRRSEKSARPQRLSHTTPLTTSPKNSREEFEAEAHHNTVKRLARPPESDSIRDSLPGWPGGYNGPVEA